MTREGPAMQEIDKVYTKYNYHQYNLPSSYFVTHDTPYPRIPRGAIHSPTNQQPAITVYEYQHGETLVVA